jgi:hypothetical protein
VASERPGATEVKLFLSYDSEQFALAESLTQRLEAAGHDVFFDRHDLLPGDAYDREIAARVARAQAMIFLASKTSIAPGAYALSELKLAEQRWPRPHGRVIGVLLDGIGPAEVPAYLRSVSLLQPQGDVVAEVVHAVTALAARRRRRAWSLGGVALAGGAALAAGSVVWWKPPAAARSPYAIVDAQVERADAAWRLRTTLRNGSGRRVTTVGLALKADRDTIRFPSSLEWFDVHAGQTVAHAMPVELVGADDGAPFKWRLCWRSVDAVELAGAAAAPAMLDTLIAERGREVCTPLRAWP